MTPFQLNFCHRFEKLSGTWLPTYFPEIQIDGDAVDPALFSSTLNWSNDATLKLTLRSNSLSTAAREKGQPGYVNKTTPAEVKVSNPSVVEVSDVSGTSGTSGTFSVSLIGVCCEASSASLSSFGLCNSKVVLPRSTPSWTPNNRPRVAARFVPDKSSCSVVKWAAGKPSFPAKDSIVPPKRTPHESLQNKPIAAAVIEEIPKVAPKTASIVDPTCVITTQSTTPKPTIGTAFCKAWARSCWDEGGEGEGATDDNDDTFTSLCWFLYAAKQGAGPTTFRQTIPEILAHGFIPNIAVSDGTMFDMFDGEPGHMVSKCNKQCPKPTAS